METLPCATGVVPPLLTKDQRRQKQGRKPRWCGKPGKKRKSVSISKTPSELPEEIVETQLQQSQTLRNISNPSTAWDQLGGVSSSGDTP